MYGDIESSWRVTGMRFELTVHIPPNTSATVHVPGAQPVEIGAGTHEFQSELR
jgi:alpha-L-rhamnosidase